MDKVHFVFFKGSRLVEFLQTIIVALGFLLFPLGRIDFGHLSQFIHVFVK